MSTATTMIFCGTAAWKRSENCQVEYDQYHTQNGKRHQRGQRVLQGISLLFDEPGAPREIEDTIPIRTTKRYVVNNPAQRAKLTGNYRDFRTIDEGTSPGCGA